MDQTQFQLKQLGIQTFEPEQCKITNAEIQEIQNLYHVELPDIYKWALTTYGEFCIEEGYFFPTNGSRGIALGYFLGQELLKIKDEIDERLPSQVIPICDDLGNNWVCLSLRGDYTYGHVYYHHHCVGFEEDSDQGKFETFDLLSTSIESFFHEIKHNNDFKEYKLTPTYISSDFVVERDVPETFWILVEKMCNHVLRTRRVLKDITQQEFIELFITFEDVRAEMVDMLGNKLRALNASEDTLNDLASSIISEGKEYYCSIYNGTLPLPPRDDWEYLSNISIVFSDVYQTRFNRDIDDDVKKA
jgi:hypothetical protein